MKSKQIGPIGPCHGLQEKTWAPQAAQLLGACFFDAAAPVRPCNATLLMNMGLKMGYINDETVET
jgi:hypothetical protein